MSSSIAVIIVNWNAADVLVACLDSILAQEYEGPVEIIVVDNASSDRSLDLLERYASRVIVLPSASNLGFARASNVGFGRSRATVSVFLNPDTELLGPTCLERLVTPLTDHSVGLVGPRLVNADGSTQQSCAAIPSMANLLLLAVGAHHLLPDRARRRYAPLAWSHDRASDTGWVNGACFAMRSSEYRRLGGLSESTFMYGEDLELGYRVRKSNLRVRYVRCAEVLHLRDVSSAQRWSPAETAAKVAVGESVFLGVRYAGWKAHVARGILYAAYASRALVLGAMGRKERAETYSAMATAIRSSHSL